MSDPNEKPALTQNKPKRRFRILLGVSLALNLLVIGAAVGAIAKGPSSRGGPPALREVSAPYVGAFERDQKRSMRREMRAQLPERRVARAANKADYIAFLEVVRADTFDAQRASEIMETQFERAGQFQKVGRELSIKRLSEMSDSERKAYADRFEEQLENPKKREKRKER